jgi:hypothetical protein
VLNHDKGEISAVSERAEQGFQSAHAARADADRNSANKAAGVFCGI